MKKLLMLFMGFILCASSFSVAACGNGEKKPTTVTENKCTVTAVNYAAESVADIDAWANENQLNNDAYAQAGIVKSPYFTVKIGGVEVPAYAERTSRGPHSFAYADIKVDDSSKPFELEVEVTTHVNRTNPIVLPESSGVKAEVSGKTVTAKLNAFGSFTFTFDRNGTTNDGSKLPLTLMVKEKEDFVLPAGYTRRDIAPSTYTLGQLTFTDENTAYYFQRGAYVIENIVLPSNSQVYFEPGCVLTVKPLTLNNNKPAATDIISTVNTENVKIYGRAAIDFSFRQGGDNSGFRLAYNFESVKNIEVSGINSVNSAGWTFCFSNCIGVKVHDLMIVAFRTYSDGIMLSDCRDAVIYGNFIRTGDDAAEVKSTTSGSVKTDNVVFEYNAVWTDKGIAYGAVYESNHDQKNVTWRNNSVGYALASWSDHLGCTTICMFGNIPTVTNENLRFENIEIYTSYCPVTTICLHQGGNVRNIYFSNITAKYVILDENLYRGPIDLLARKSHNGSVDDVSGIDPDNYSIRALYFDNILINGSMLTADNKEDFITTKMIEGVDFDYRNIKVNTRL